VTFSLRMIEGRTCSLITNAVLQVHFELDTVHRDITVTIIYMVMVSLLQKDRKLII